MASSSPFLSISLMLCFILFMSTPKAMQQAHAMNEKETHLHFYYHERLTGPNANIIVSAGQNLTSTGFGKIYVIDDELRVGPQTDSKLIGRVQGIVPVASLDGSVLVVNFIFVFTAGKYNGSTLAVMGRWHSPDPLREFSVVGGTGKFRLAKGYAIGESVSLVNGVAVVDYKFYVRHP